MIEIILTK